jgi:hypothetical protein
MAPEPYVFNDTSVARTRLIEAWPSFMKAASPKRGAELVLDVLAPYDTEKPIRDHMRRRFPSGADGFVPEDIDLIIRRYGVRYHLDAEGVLRLLEMKWRPGFNGAAVLGLAQHRTFSLLDEMCSSSAIADRYEGFFVVTHENPNPFDGRVWLDHFGTDRPPILLTGAEFELWLRGDVHVDLWRS